MLIRIQQRNESILQTPQTDLFGKIKMCLAPTNGSNSGCNTTQIICSKHRVMKGFGNARNSDCKGSATEEQPLETISEI